MGSMKFWFGHRKRTRTETSQPTLDLRPYVGGVTMAEATEGLQALGAVLRAQDQALLGQPGLRKSISQARRGEGTVVRTQTSGEESTR